MARPRKTKTTPTAKKRRGRPARTTDIRTTTRAAKNETPAFVGKAKTLLTGWLDRHGAGDWLTIAAKQRATLVREVRHLGDEIVERISTTPIFQHREQLIREARGHVESILDNINASSLVSRAIDKAKESGSELLSFLNVPTQSELRKLQLRLNQIETKLVKSKRGGKTRMAA